MTLLHFWRTHAAEFAALLGQHVVLVGVSTRPRSPIGVPVGILAARRPRLGAPIVWLANVVQTIPSLAMFGFLLPLPLVGGLGARVGDRRADPLRAAADHPDDGGRACASSIACSSRRARRWG